MRFLIAHYGDIFVQIFCDEFYAILGPLSKAYYGI